MGTLGTSTNAEEFQAILKHLLGRDDEKHQEAKPVLAKVVNFPRWNIADNYSQAIGLDSTSLQSLPVVYPVVFAPAFSWVPALSLLGARHPEVSTGQTASVTSPVGSP